MERLRNLLALIRGEMWIIPTTMAVGAVWLAVWLLNVPDPPDFKAAGEWWLASGDVDTARELLSAFLSGLLTMTSLVVSLTFVILSLAANQLGPRIILQFMSDRQIQAVIGLFVGTLLFVLVVLANLDSDADHSPDLPLSVASGAVVACVAALLFYVNKVAQAIIADNVLEAIAERLKRAGAALPDAADEDPESGTLAQAWFDEDGAVLSFETAGYIQTYKFAKLVSAATEADVRIVLLVAPGDHVLRCGAHVRLPGVAQVPEALASAIRDAVIIGPERSPSQDIGFLMRQIVEVAVRALSPGINDPFTAIAAIDQFAAVFERLSAKSLGLRRHCDPTGALRVIGKGDSFEHLLKAGFDPIRRAGARNVDILERLALAIESLKRTTFAQSRDMPAAYAAFLDRLEASIQAGDFTPLDRRHALSKVAAARDAA
jgi:uncharacterized membrane protein